MLDPKPTLITLLVVAVVFLVAWGIVALTAIVPFWTIIGLLVLAGIFTIIFFGDPPN